MKDFTSINILLDRSGSMESCRDETISGFNIFLREQRAAGNNADVTLVQFDSGGIDTVMNAVPIGTATDLTKETYVPRASTPLLDALGRTIVSVGERLGEIPEADRPDKVVFVIITDGQENASREYTRPAINKMIERQTKDYSWQFVYLGANQNAFAEASAIGIDNSRSANYSTANTASAYMATSSNVSAFRKTMNKATMDWSAKQREELKDGE